VSGAFYASDEIRRNKDGWKLQAENEKPDDLEERKGERGKRHL